jgi:hypothetical protein
MTKIIGRAIAPKARPRQVTSANGSQSDRHVLDFLIRQADFIEPEIASLLAHEELDTRIADGFVGPESDRVPLLFGADGKDLGKTVIAHSPGCSHCELTAIGRRPQPRR